MTARSSERANETRQRQLSAAFVVLAAVSLALAIAIPLVGVEAELPEFTGSSVGLSSGALISANELLSGPGLVIDHVDAQASAALAGYGLVLGSHDDSGWQIDLAEAGPAADVAIERAMAGAYELGLSVERSGASVIAGTGDLPRLPADAADDDRVAALAAMVEVSGDVSGLLARVPEDRTVAVVALAESIGLAPRVVAHGPSNDLVLDRLSDRETVASWTFACLERVPLLGARGCDGPANLLAFNAADTGADAASSQTGTSIGDWRVGTTGPLDRRESHWLTAADGAVGWTNGEAQQYRDTAVTSSQAGLTLTASEHPEPRVDRAPFDSGLLVSEDTYGWGRIEVDVSVPIGHGLWPAVWLLDAEACSAPGYCEGYGTTQYHEIDLLETSGDTNVSTSVHWFDDRIRSLSTTSDQAVIGDAAMHTIAIDRRPGMLVWYLDGVEIDRVVGVSTAEVGPHRATPMRLVVNLAVGGTFAGDRLLGPTSPWWGSSMVPASYPNLGWTTASMTVGDARFTTLDELVLG